MKELFVYFWDKKKTILFFFLIAFFYWLVLALCGLPLAPLAYSFVLSFVIGVVLFVYCYLRYSRKKKELDALTALDEIHEENLSIADSSLEDSYLSIIKKLIAQNREIKSIADSEKSDMIAYYSMWVHQIKTPIQALRLLLEANPSADGVMEAELFHIEEYVNMVLTYIRLGSDSTDYVFKEYSLDEMIKKSIRKYAKLFIKKKITLIYDETGKTLLTDEKWFCFVIEQILSNALKYTKKGSITVTVAKGLLTITDTGIGIASEDLPRVFENGYTGYNGRADKKSTGIGLYLCRRILTRLGQEISIASVEGKGTSVSITLHKINLIVE